MNLNSPFKGYDGEIVPRKEGDPLTHVTGTLLDHRVMRTDSARIAKILNQNDSLEAEHVKALAGFTRGVVMAVLRHHQIEDDISWGLLEACAGSQVDLTPFADDHEKLHMSIVETIRLLSIFEGGGEFPLKELAAVMSEISEELDEHIEKEEETIWRSYPQYVSQSTEDAQVQFIAVRYPPDELLSFVLPWFFHHATPEENAFLREAVAPVVPMVEAEMPAFLALRAKALGE